MKVRNIVVERLVGVSPPDLPSLVVSDILRRFVGFVARGDHRKRRDCDHGRRKEELTRPSTMWMPMMKSSRGASRIEKPSPSSWNNNNEHFVLPDGAKTTQDVSKPRNFKPITRTKFDELKFELTPVGVTVREGTGWVAYDGKFNHE